MQKAFVLFLTIVMSLLCTFVVACEDSSVHTHEYVNGVCACGQEEGFEEPGKNNEQEKEEGNNNGGNKDENNNSGSDVKGEQVTETQWETNIEESVENFEFFGEIYLIDGEEESLYIKFRQGRDGDIVYLAEEVGGMEIEIYLAKEGEDYYFYWAMNLGQDIDGLDGSWSRIKTTKEEGEMMLESYAEQSFFEYYTKEMDDFTFDESLGAYVLDELVTDGFVEKDIVLKFKDGKPIYFSSYMELMGEEMRQESRATYGTTDYTLPTEYEEGSFDDLEGLE